MKKRFISRFWAVMTALALSMTVFNAGILTALAADYNYSGFDAYESPEAAKAKLRAEYGENHQITDDNYDKSLAVKCINGTFVGKKTENTIAYRGIPFVGEQPVGEHRWKAPVDYVPPARMRAQVKRPAFMFRARTACI